MRCLCSNQPETEPDHRVCLSEDWGSEVVTHLRVKLALVGKEDSWTVILVQKAKQKRIQVLGPAYVEEGI